MKHQKPYLIFGLLLMIISAIICIPSVGGVMINGWALMIIAEWVMLFALCFAGLLYSITMAKQDEKESEAKER